ncbi:MAG: hypothetical protein R2710_16120 [Acidimicrobiales bacterium]
MRDGVGGEHECPVVIETPDGGVVAGCGVDQDAVRTSLLGVRRPNTWANSLGASRAPNQRRG